ncbi:MAG TPA: rod shape-determining protein MreD [Candidatus Polarisedimenticolia bacterium]|nr:rod shape-determining protein MreD [Candidatus Polarisedimenticolia bacterium]
MRLFLGILAVVASAAAQAALSGISPRWATFFDLPLVVVIYYAIAKGPNGALLAGTSAGLLQDSLEGTLLGVSALSKSLVGYLVGMVGLRFALAPVMSRVLVLAAATVLSRSIEVGTLAIMGRRLAYSPYPTMITTMLGNCLLAAMTYGALRREAPE